MVAAINAGETQLACLTLTSCCLALSLTGHSPGVPEFIFIGDCFWKYILIRTGGPLSGELEGCALAPDSLLGFASGYEQVSSTLPFAMAFLPWSLIDGAHQKLQAKINLFSKVVNVRDCIPVRRRLIHTGNG